MKTNGLRLSLLSTPEKDSGPFGAVLMSNHNRIGWCRPDAARSSP